MMVAMIGYFDYLAAVAVDPGVVVVVVGASCLAVDPAPEAHHPDLCTCPCAVGSGVLAATMFS